MSNTNPTEGHQGHQGHQGFQVQVFGARWGGFTAYVPHLDLEVQGDTFDEAERRAVDAARAAYRKERP